MTMDADRKSAGRMGYLVVPVTRRGMLLQMMGLDDQAGEDDLLFVPFTSAEMAASAGMMLAFENLFGFDSRGGTVEQLIDTRYAGAALDVANAMREHAADAVEESAARKMARALETALDCGSFVEFYFGGD